MLPSTQAPPAARMMPSISSAVRGATALPLTNMIFLPVDLIAAATSRALVTACAGSSTEMMTSTVATSFSTEPQSVTPALADSAIVRLLRPSSEVKIS